MFRWAHPEHLYALLVVPVLISLLVYSIKNRRRKISRIGDQELVKRLLEETSERKPLVKGILLIIAYALLVLAWANPQIGSRLEEVKREGVDIMIALDISNSMRAEDLRPNRLERAKQFISRLIDKLQNDRIGIVIFAGKAYVQLPITTDYGAAKLFLSTIDPSLIATQGTNIGEAINLCQSSFKGTENKYKTIIILTDGEETVKKYADRTRISSFDISVLEETEKATDKGIIIHTVGLGLIEGTPIPTGSGISNDFLKDKDGQTVITKLDESSLEEIASLGNGLYIRAAQGNNGLQVLIDQIGKMEKRNFGTKQYTDYEDRFQYLLFAALMALVTESLVGERKSYWIRRLKLFETDEKNID